MVSSGILYFVEIEICYIRKMCRFKKLEKYYKYLFREKNNRKYLVFITADFFLKNFAEKSVQCTKKPAIIKTVSVSDC